ncbi:MAG: DUF1559 domain-containing protein [Planctomycetes bacterium]|nr:DUF1559 domain-containing protein [Planctomycetota bacterium]
MSSDYEFDPTILDLHLGRLSETEQAALRQRINDDPTLASQNEALDEVFRALHALEAPRAPEDLLAKITARVAQGARPPKVLHPPTSSTEPREESLGWILRVRNVRDIVAVAAMIVLAVGLGVPSLLHVRERNQRMGCSWNLAQLGRGMQAYAGAFSDSLPFAGWDQRSSWKPTGSPGVETMPNRRHVYPLLLAGNVQPAWFVCPSRRDIPMAAEQVKHSNDFTESRNVSYAYQNMAGVRATLADGPDLVVLADDNPLFDNGLPLFDLPRRLGLTDPTMANSEAHRGKGQNILTIGGHVKWTTRPDCGVAGDNIWMLSNVTEYTGREGPETATDSHLLK